MAQLQPLTWERKVRDAIEEQLPEGEPSAERIAQALHLSLRSLQRHLADEGCRFERCSTKAARTSRCCTCAIRSVR